MDGCINFFICSIASTSLSSSGMNLKFLMKFYLISFHKNVSPHASSILYHLFGKSSNVDGNSVDVFVSSECIHLCILCLVT